MMAPTVAGPYPTWPVVLPEFQHTAVELCCGMGGIRLGLEAAGYRVMKAYDSWADATAIYNHNAPWPIASSCDILSGGGLKAIKNDCWRFGEIDLLAAGPPCKGFSQIRNGHHGQPNRHNGVLLAIPEYVAILRPRLVLIENVPSLVGHDDGKTFRKLLQDLERPGPSKLRYRVGYGVYDAALYGTPQARRRILVLAVRKGSGRERLPEESPDLTRFYTTLRRGREIREEFRPYADRLADLDDLSMTSSFQALSDLPSLGPGEPEIPRLYSSSPDNAFQRAMRMGAPELLKNTQTPAVRDDTVRRLEMISPGGCAGDIPRSKINGLSRRFGSAYRRLHPDAPSTALSTKYDCVYHYGDHRSLSVREYARLQGIPDNICFPTELTSRRNAYEMIGNAVPPFLVYGVLAQIAISDRWRKAA